MRTDRAPVLLCLALVAAGFKGDGSGRYPTATPPLTWSTTSPVVWRTPLATWSNASPVVLGGLVCTTEEPVTLTCLDKATGTVRWRASNDVVGTLPAAEQPALRTRIAELEKLEATLPGLLQEQSAIRRALRSTAAPADGVSRLEQVSRAIVEIQARRAELGRYLTPADKDQIGWATPTPTTDGRSLFTLFGNGVVARYEADGTRVWVRWLGEPPRDTMNGYSLGTTASPVLVDGVLVIGFDNLLGLDPTTGATRWSVPRFRDYGTPSVVRVGGVAYVLTPDGRAVRAKDGVVVLSDLAPTWFNGVDVVGTDVYTAASIGREADKRFIATRTTLAAGGSQGLTATVRWQVTQEAYNRVYSTPIVHNGKLLVTDDNGWLYTFDIATGSASEPVRLPSAGKGHYASLQVVGSRVLTGSEGGVSTWLDVGATVTVAGQGTSEGFRSTALPEGSRLYLRTVRGMVAVGR